MSYATPQDFVDSFPVNESHELSDLDGLYSQSQPILDVTRIQAALDKAYSEINSYRVVRGDGYPFIDDSGRLKQIEIIIARKNLNCYSWPENDPRYRDYKDVLRWLEMYSKGLVSLPPSSSDSGSSVSSVGLYIPNYRNSIDFQIFGNI